MENNWQIVVDRVDNDTRAGCTRGAAGGGRDDPLPANIQANCTAQGVPEGLLQLNPQLSATSAGNENLIAEESDIWTAGFVWSPSWSEGQSWTDGITASIDFYNLEIDNAAESFGAPALITACAETNDPFFCDNVPRVSSGQLGVVNNQLQFEEDEEAEDFIGRVYIELEFRDEEGSKLTEAGHRFEFRVKSEKIATSSDHAELLVVKEALDPRTREVKVTVKPGEEAGVQIGF